MARPFAHLMLEETENSRISVVTQVATAELFGWDTAFPRWKPVTHTRPDGTEFFYMHPRVIRNPAVKGGKRLRICRDPKKSGYPAGKTHCFRMKGAWSNRHLVMLAEVAGEKFEWMEGRHGERIDRDVWLA